MEGERGRRRRRRIRRILAAGRSSKPLSYVLHIYPMSITYMNHIPLIAM